MNNEPSDTTGSSTESEDHIPREPPDQDPTVADAPQRSETPTVDGTGSTTTQVTTTTTNQPSAPQSGSGDDGSSSDDSGGGEDDMMSLLPDGDLFEKAAVLVLSAGAILLTYHLLHAPELVETYGLEGWFKYLLGLMILLPILEIFGTQRLQKAANILRDRRRRRNNGGGSS